MEVRVRKGKPLRMSISCCVPPLDIRGSGVTVAVQPTLHWDTGTRTRLLLVITGDKEAQVTEVIQSVLVESWWWSY